MPDTAGVRALLPLLLLAPVLAAAACSSSKAPAVPTPTPTPATPLEIHQRLLVLDTHLDTPANFVRPGWNIGERHTQAGDMTQVDLPRMAEGGLDGGFWVIFTEQGPLTRKGYARARAHAFDIADRIAATVAGHADRMALATTPADARRIAGEGKIVVFQSIENSYPLGDDLGLLAKFYDRGVRMAGPVHAADNQFADSATGHHRWGGLSPLGRRWVAEMNRLGMLIDASHASDAAFDQLLALSKTPIILSHSGPRSRFDHPRNLDDRRIKALAAKGGVIQVNSIFLAKIDNSPERAALDAIKDRIDGMTPEAQRQLAARYADLDRRRPLQDADFDLFMASLLHVLKLVGPDHVGIGADWDGGGGVKGMADVAALPKVTAALLKAGYSEADIAKIWSGNLLRVLGQAEQARKP